MRATSWRPALISRVACGRSAGSIWLMAVLSKKHGRSRSVSSPACSMRTTAPTNDSAALVTPMGRTKPAFQLYVRRVESQTRRAISISASAPNAFGSEHRATSTASLFPSKSSTSKSWSGSDPRPGSVGVARPTTIDATTALASPSASHVDLIGIHGSSPASTR